MASQNRDVAKLLQALSADQNLTHEDDSTVYLEDQYPTAFHYSMKSFYKVSSSLRTLLETLRWTKQDTPDVDKTKLSQLEKEKSKLQKRYFLTATISNKMSTIDFRNWLYSIDNLILDSIHACMKDSTSANDSTRYLFKPSEMDNLAQTANEDRNVRGLSRFNKILVENIFQLPDNVDSLISDITDKDLPILTAQLQDDDGDVQIKAKQKIHAAQTAIKSNLKVIQEANNTTFLVMLWDLIPGAREGESQLFARIRDNREKHLLRQKTLPVDQRTPYLAKDAIDFIREHYVEDNKAARHSAWDKILMATRQPKQKLYDWLISFDILCKSYLATVTNRRTMSAENQKIVRIRIGRQINDREMMALSSISFEYDGSNIEQGVYDINRMKSHVAENESRFRTFKHDKRTLENIRYDRNFHNRPLPDFMITQEVVKKRSQSSVVVRGPNKKNRYVYSLEDKHSKGFEKGKGTLPKGFGKGKGKNTKDSYGRGLSRTPWFHGNTKKGKGKGKPGKGKKGKESGGRFNKHRPASLQNPFLHKRCDFCHELGHIKKHCPKAQKLQNSTLYMEKKIRRKPQEQYCIEVLENSEGLPHCSWCFQQHCTPDSCQSPVQDRQEFDRTALYFSSSGMKEECAAAKQSEAHPPWYQYRQLDSWSPGAHYSNWGEPTWDQYHQNSWDYDTWDQYYIDREIESLEDESYGHEVSNDRNEVEISKVQYNHGVSNDQPEEWYEDAGMGANMHYKGDLEQKSHIGIAPVYSTMLEDRQSDKSEDSSSVSEDE